jgi:hypothetical protein
MGGKSWKFMSLPLSEKMVFSEALFYQILVGLLLKIIPFKWIPRFFSNPPNHSPDARHPAPDAAFLQAIKTATIRSSPFSPWKNKCLVQSLSIRWMLRRRKIQSQLSLGVILGQDNKMLAHAWLKAGDFEVVEQNGDYKELFRF